MRWGRSPPPYGRLGPGRGEVPRGPCAAHALNSLNQSIAATRSAADARLRTGSTAGKSYWLTAGTGPEVGFGPPGSQGFRRHRARASPCLRSAFRCGLAALSGRLVPSGGTGGPWQLRPVSCHLSRLGEGGIPGDSQGQTATGVARAGGGAAEPAGWPTPCFAPRPR